MFVHAFLEMDVTELDFLKAFMEKAGVEHTTVVREGRTVAILGRSAAVKLVDVLTDIAFRRGGVAWRLPFGVAAYAAGVFEKRAAVATKRAEKYAYYIREFRLGEAEARRGRLMLDAAFLLKMAEDVANFRFLKEGVEDDVRRLFANMADPGKRVVRVPARLFRRYSLHFIPKIWGDRASLGSGVLIRLIERGVLRNFEAIAGPYAEAIELRLEAEHAAHIGGGLVRFKIYRLGEFKRVAVAEAEDPAALAAVLGIRRFPAAEGKKVYLSVELVSRLEELGLLPPPSLQLPGASWP